MRTWQALTSAPLLIALLMPLGLTLRCTQDVLSHDDLRMARDASHKLQLLQAQAQQVEELQRQLAQHRRNTAEWKERCRQQVSWASGRRGWYEVDGGVTQ